MNTISEPLNIRTTCPWCGDENAMMENPDHPRVGRIAFGTCNNCIRAFEVDTWEYLDLEDQAIDNCLELP